jgi:hypothetical protein
LTALEAASLDLSSAQLVVLSACDTAPGFITADKKFSACDGACAPPAQDRWWPSNDVVTRKIFSRAPNRCARTHLIALQVNNA